jgi:hypothetical protein
MTKNEDELVGKQKKAVISLSFKDYSGICLTELWEAIVILESEKSYRGIHS